jgi:hypothetical protein
MLCHGLGLTAQVRLLLGSAQARFALLMQKSNFYNKEPKTPLRPVSSPNFLLPTWRVIQSALFDTKYKLKLHTYMKRKLDCDPVISVSPHFSLAAAAACQR